MKTLVLRFCSVFVFSITVFAAKAGDESVRPFALQFDLKALAKASLNLFNGKTTSISQFVPNAAEKPTNRVCVCEILEVENNERDYKSVAVLAEKENDGNIGKNYRLAEQQISLEKKQMKAMYFNKLRVNTKIAVATDCLSLYLKLSQKTNDLKLYDILDADIRSAIH